jgi:hypothetical protein
MGSHEGGTSSPARATRSIGTFVQDHPRILTWAWKVAERTLPRLQGLFLRLGFERSSRLVCIGERPFKRWLFDCRMCGQCVLHFTGMTCPMTCPKQLRNGPCGGVRPNGGCEVDASMNCVWVKAIERAERTPYADELHLLSPAVDWRLEGKASWVTYSLGLDQQSVDADVSQAERPS